MATYTQRYSVTTLEDEAGQDRRRKFSSWVLFAALLLTIVFLAVQLTAARHEISKAESCQN